MYIIYVFLIIIVILLILLPLMVLLVPVRYDARVRFPREVTDTLEYDVRIRGIWLFHIVSFLVKLKSGEETIIRLKLFGIPIRMPAKSSNSRKNEVVLDNKTDIVDNNDSNDSNDSIVNSDIVLDTSQTHDFTAGSKKRKSRKNKLKRVGNKLLKFKDAINNPDNIAAFRIFKERIIKILKHLRPKTVKLDMLIGTGDPCNTGILFGGIGFVMTMWPGRYKIYPDFNNKTIQGNAYIKGRAMLGVLAYHVFKLMFDKDFVHIWKKETKNKRGLVKRRA